MTVSFNPANILDVLALLLRRKKERKEKVVEYVESIAAEAASLASVWQKIFDEIGMGKTVSPRDDPAVAEEIKKYWAPNAPYYQRLQAFYAWASVALGDKIESRDHESLVNHLASLLRDRDLTMKSYRESVEQLERYSRSDQFFVLDPTPLNIDLRDFAQSVAALQREAAALHVLAKTIRASD